MNDIKNTNPGCIIPAPVLREAVRHASNDRPEAALQSLETYGLSEEQKAKISGIFQLCKGDPLAAPEWQRRIVAVINNEDIAESNAVGPGKSCENEENSLIISNACIDPNCDVSILHEDIAATAPVINNEDIAESNAVGPGKSCESEENSLVIYNPCIAQNDDISILHEDIFTTIFTCAIDSKSYVFLAETCKLTNKVFQSKIVQICFINQKIKELSLQSFNAYWEHLNWLPKSVIKYQKKVEANRNPTHLCEALQQSFQQEAEVQKTMIMGLKIGLNLPFLPNPYPAIGKSLIIFSPEAAKIEKLHSDAFFIYAQDKLQLYKKEICFITEDDLYSPILRTICNSVCHEILFSFASQPLGEITPETFEKIISHVKELLISIHSDIEGEINLKGDEVLRVLITKMILDLHSIKEYQQFAIELNKVGIDRADFLIRHTYYDRDLENAYEMLNRFFEWNNLEAISPDAVDEAVQGVAYLFHREGVEIDIDDIKRITKKVILEHYAPEEIEQYAETLYAMYENGDVIGKDYYKSLAEFYLDLLN